LRIRLAIILILIAGAIVAASLLLNNRALSSGQLAQVRASCLTCHSVELRYSNANSIHDIHASLNCSQCHVENGLQTTVSIHSILEWLGVGLGAAILVAIITNFIVAHRRIQAG
jgi:hypothetical protein